MTQRPPGPPPKSADVIEMTGNRGKLSAAEIEARREAEVRARPLDVRPPATLSNYGRECWDLHAPELKRLNLLTHLDAGAFEMVCEVYAMARTALDEMRPRRADGEPDKRKKGIEVVDRDRVHGGMLKRSAPAAVFLQAQKEYRAWCVSFGLTPADRIHLRPATSGATPAGQGDTDDDAAFFG